MQSKYQDEFARIFVVFLVIFVLGGLLILVLAGAAFMGRPDLFHHLSERGVLLLLSGWFILSALLAYRLRENPRIKRILWK